MENIGSERPGAPDMGKHKSRVPSDALALRLCSEIVQGQVRATPPLWFFHGLFALGGEFARRGTGGLTADT